MPIIYELLKSAAFGGLGEAAFFDFVSRSDGALEKALLLVKGIFLSEII